MIAGKPKVVAAAVLAAAVGVLVSHRAADAVPAPPETPGRALAALEAKLHGDWHGVRDCAGDITFRADGTFERRHYGPGNETVDGTWQLRWDALPPTLVFFEAPGDPKAAGEVRKVKLVALDDAAFAYQYPGSGGASRYTRGNKAGAAGGPASDDE